MSGDFIAAAEARWDALRAGRKVAFLGLITIGIFAAVSQVLP